MSSCGLNYIPNRLHWNDKPILDSFQIGDLIYRRCKHEDIENPFGKISLREISNNIGTSHGEEISVQDDVLFNIDPKDENYLYDEQIPCTLTIRELTDNQYSKTYYVDDGNCLLKLLHAPIACMYPHCNFDIWLNNEKVTRENYDSTLNTKKLQQLRTKIRQDLALMVIRKEIRFTFD